MKQLTAFTRKEFMELTRTGKLFILMVLFVLFGIMNPAIAKLTPWMMEIMSDNFAETGFTVTSVDVNALTSWTQFYKNMPILLIVFLLLFSSTLTLEYQKGTLINMVTKGMKRWKILVSKAVTMSLLWTAGYWLCYGITYGYNAYFWDNRIAAHLFFPAFCFYLEGLWLLTLLLLLSVILRTNSSVVMSVGGTFLVFYLLGLLPVIKKYLPVYLMDSSSLLTGNGNISEYYFTVIFTIILCTTDIIAAIIFFNRKNI
ncbi:MAG: ABC transporter permease subunit [Lachnospiraceae bacterium]|nr:ABC transporter permease subunit [Lachnospiraceae bacterium]